MNDQDLEFERDLDDAELEDEARVARMSLIALVWIALLVAAAVWVESTLLTVQHSVECVRYALPGEAPPPGSCVKKTGGGG